MLTRVTMPGVELPRLYMAENKLDVNQATRAGVPYIKWTRGNDELIRVLLRPTLEKMFPGIRWDKFLGPKPKFETEVIMQCRDEIDDHNVAVAESEPFYFTDQSFIEPDPEDLLNRESEEASVPEEWRYHHDTDDTYEVKLPLDVYMADACSHVNLDVLQSLHLMPQFIGDIMDCIRTNLIAQHRWAEGWNKKLGAAVGNFNRSNQLPNLIILDISGSIPRGISATMLTLLDTLRSQLSADVIITASCSKFFKHGEELPDPQTLRNAFGYANEDRDFFDILKTKIKGQHYGHVFSFGDYDSPYWESFNDEDLRGTKVEYAHSYHTTHPDMTGYLRWVNKLQTKPPVETDCSWCEYMRS